MRTPLLFTRFYLVVLDLSSLPPHAYSNSFTLSTFDQGLPRWHLAVKKQKKTKKNKKPKPASGKVSCQCRRLRETKGFDPGAGAEYIVGTQSIVVFERIIKLSLFTKFDKCNVSINEDHVQ